MLWQVSFDGHNRFIVQADPRLHGVLELVGGRWSRSDRGHVVSRKQLDDAEWLVDSGFVGESQGWRGGRPDPDDCEAYHPGLDLVVYDRARALELAAEILPKPVRAQSVRQLQLQL